MKKYIWFLVLGAISLSCAKEHIVSEKQQAEPITGGKIVSFAVSVENADETRATLSSASDFTWQSTDRASVYSHNAKKIELTPSNISGGNAIFTGTLDDDDYIEEGAIVVFPAERHSGVAKVTFPSYYSSSSATQGPTLAARVAKNKTLDFKYLAGTVAITITDMPSIASSLYINTVNPSNESEHVVCTGTFTIDYSSTTPALTDPESTGNNVTISNSSFGSETFYIPLPTAGPQELFFDIKTKNYYDVEANLFSKHITFSGGNSVTRNMFAVLSKAISPEVFFVSDMTGWNGDSKASMSLSGTTGTVSLNALSGKHWRPIVVYPTTNYWVMYGFSGSNSDQTQGTFNNVTGLSDGQMSALVGESNANYSLSFNYVSAAYSSTKNNDSEIGDFYFGSENFAVNGVMTKLTDKIAYAVKQWGSTLYGYYNNYAASQGGNWKVDNENYYIWIYDFASNTMKPQWSFCNFSGTWDFVKLKSSSDDWQEHEMTRTANGSPAWFIDVNWSGDTEFGFEAQGPNQSWRAWQGNDNEPITGSISDYCPVITKVGNNYKVSPGKYTILFFESNRVALLKRD